MFVIECVYVCVRAMYRVSCIYVIVHIIHNLSGFLLLVAKSIISSESQMANRPKRLTQYFNDSTATDTIFLYTRTGFDDDDVRQARKLSFNRLVIMLH